MAFSQEIGLMETTGPGKVWPTKEPRRRLLTGAVVAPLILLVAVPGASARQVLLMTSAANAVGGVNTVTGSPSFIQLYEYSDAYVTLYGLAADAGNNHLFVARSDLPSGGVLLATTWVNTT
jgi:hypothetical protein